MSRPDDLRSGTWPYFNGSIFRVSFSASRCLNETPFENIRATLVQWWGMSRNEMEKCHDIWQFCRSSQILNAVQLWEINRRWTFLFFMTFPIPALITNREHHLLSNFWRPVSCQIVCSKPLTAWKSKCSAPNPCELNLFVFVWHSFFTFNWIIDLKQRQKCFCKLISLSEIKKNCRWNET